MNILSINKFFWKKGGSESVFFGEMELLKNNGHKVVPFSMKSENNEESAYSRYFVDKVDYASSGSNGKIKAAMNIIYSFEASSKMKQLLQEFVPDIAHFHIFQHQISPSVMGPLKNKKIPLVLTLHDLKPICPIYTMYTNGKVCEACKGRKFYNCFIKKCTKGSRFKSLINTIEMYFHYMMGYYQNVDRYIAVSHFHRNKMLENGFDEDQVVYIPNYIDVNKFHLPYNDEGYGLCFGRLSHEKGLEHFLDAASITCDVPMYIAGTGPLEDKLKIAVKQRGINNIKFLGFVSGDELLNLISLASFTVISSIVYENCPMSVLESLALETPVIGANIGGIPELVENNVDGYIYEPGNSDELAEKINQMMLDSNARRIMGETGRRKIVEHFDKDQHYEKLLALYEEIIT